MHAVSVPSNQKLMNKLSYDNAYFVSRASSPHKILSTSTLIAIHAMGLFVASSMYIALNDCRFSGKFVESSWFILTTGSVISYALANIVAAEKIDKQEKSWLTKVSKNGWDLKDLPKYLQDRRDIVFAAIKKEGLAIQHSPLLFKYDQEIVNTALATAPAASMYLPYRPQINHVTILMDQKAD